MKTKDPFIITIVAGGIGTVVQMFISWTLYLLGIITQNPSIFNARLLTNHMNINSSELALGIISNISAGLFFAGIIHLILRITSFDYSIVKGSSLGILFGMFQFMFLSRLFHNPSDLIPNAITIWHVYIVYSIFGGISGYFLRKYSIIGVTFPDHSF